MATVPQILEASLQFEIRHRQPRGTTTAETCCFSTLRLAASSKHLRGSEAVQKGGLFVAVAFRPASRELPLRA
jgi:hypothetical protein